MKNWTSLKSKICYITILVLVDRLFYNLLKILRQLGIVYPLLGLCRPEEMSTISKFLDTFREEPKMQAVLLKYLDDNAKKVFVSQFLIYNIFNIVPRPCGRVDGNQSRFKGLFSAVQKGLPPLLLLYSSFCFLNVFFHIFFVSFFAFSSFLNSWQFFRQTFSQKKNNSNSSKTGSQMFLDCHIQIAGRFLVRLSLSKVHR